MSVNFDLSVTSQSVFFFADAKVKANEKLIQFSEKHTNLARFTGLPIALCSSLFDIAQAVSNIGESLIKGLANIFGSPFSKKCSFLKGAKQLFLQAPLKFLLDATPLPLSIAIEILVRPIITLASPTYIPKLSNTAAKQNKADLENKDLDSVNNSDSSGFTNKMFNLLYN